MKKILSIIMALHILLLCSCSLIEHTKNSSSNQIIATTFPAYDFAKQICQTDFDVNLLLKPGEDSHTFEPTPQDLIDIKKCKLLIYVGGPEEKWIDDLLAQPEYKNVNSIRMIDACDINEIDSDFDEHVWTSPKNAVAILDEIKNKLIEIDSDKYRTYTGNSNEYASKILALDTKFKQIAAKTLTKPLVFADRFPFYYLAKDYNLNYLSVFTNCTEQTEPDIKTVTDIINKIKENNVTTVFTIEFSNEKLADNICEQTGTKKATLYSCHNVSSDDFYNNVSYVDLMDRNYEALEEALQ